MKKKPNIIIFNPDEMRWDTMGHMGNPAACTPYLDSFSKEEAVSFRNAFCQNPVCVPSRCSFLTGLYPHVRGHRTMSYLLREQETSLFQELREAGYYVWMNGRNDLIAGQINGLAECHADEIYCYDKKKSAPRLTALPEASEENRYPYSHFKGVRENMADADLPDVQAAIDRIDHPVSDQPLCLFLGLTNPHPPYEVERKYYEKIDPTRLPQRPTAKETYEKSRMMDAIRKYSGLENFSEEEWRQMQRVYLAQCAKIDDMFRQICDALKEAGEYDNSAIFFLSDHGDYAGNYDLPEKAQNTFEDCLVKVPLLVKPPKNETVDAGIAEGIVELVDFYATVLDYAGVTSSQDHFGISLRPIVENRKQTVRKYAFCEGGRRAEEEQCDEFHSFGKNGVHEGDEYWARMTAQLDPLAHEKGTMISDQRYKFVQRLSGNNEFYDRKEDPMELCNRYDDEAYQKIILEFKEAMLQWYQRTCDIVPRDYDRRFTEEKLWGIMRNFCPPEKEEEIREFIRSGASLQECIAYAFRQ